MLSVCHKPADNRFPAPNPFFSRIHRSHVDSKERVACEACHIRQKGETFGLCAGDREISYGLLHETDLPLIRSRFASRASSSYLDAAHGRANLGCAACHGTKVAGTGARVESARCMSCHGFYVSGRQDFP